MEDNTDMKGILEKKMSAKDSRRINNMLPPNENNIQDICPHDVMCGRHRLAVGNPGNRKFRLTVSMYLDSYVQADTKRGKSQIIVLVMEVVKSTGGRFLKWDSTEKRWLELTEKQSREKVGHALRDMALAMENGNSLSNSLSDISISSQMSDTGDTISGGRKGRKRCERPASLKNRKAQRESLTWEAGSPASNIEMKPHLLLAMGDDIWQTFDPDSSILSLTEMNSSLALSDFAADNQRNQNSDFDFLYRSGHTHGTFFEKRAVPEIEDEEPACANPPSLLSCEGLKEVKEMFQNSDEFPFNSCSDILADSDSNANEQKIITQNYHVGNMVELQRSQQEYLYEEMFQCLSLEEVNFYSIGDNLEVKVNKDSFAW